MLVREATLEDDDGGALAEADFGIDVQHGGVGGVVVGANLAIGVLAGVIDAAEFQCFGDAATTKVWMGTGERLVQRARAVAVSEKAADAHQLIACEREKVAIRQRF